MSNKEKGKLNLSAQGVKDDGKAKMPNILERVDTGKEQVTEAFYRELLVQADGQIQALHKQVGELQEAQLDLRDEVALQCYVPLIKEVTDYQKAATDAYRAADVFLRVRETGINIVE